MEYQDYNDYELIQFISEGNEDAHDIMVEKYRPLVKNIAVKLINVSNNIGLEIADLEQEGMIGLLNAIDCFDESYESTFYTYARTCIKRSMISSITRAKRLKHRALNESLSFDSQDFSTQLLKDDNHIPENIIISEDYVNILINKSEKVLTNKEKQVFELLINGFTYKQIAQVLEKDTKSIDNAIQRIKKKLRDVLKKNDK